MKKIIAICLLLVMALSLCACGTKQIPDRFIGTWQSNDGTVTLTLNADGTAKFVDTTKGHDYNVLWTATNNANITISWDGTPPVGEIPAEETTEPATEETVAVEVAEEAVEGAAEGETSKRRDDPSIVGYGAMTIFGGEMLMALNEGSSTDPILFVYNSSNKLTLVKID